MANKKTHDLVAKVGERDGKAIWKNVGVLMEGDKGPYVLLDKTFNPAGVPSQDGKTSIILSAFEPKEKDAAGSQEPPWGM